MSNPNQNQSQGQGPQIQFKQIETRILGPMSLVVQSNTEEQSPAKGLDLILPAFSWSLEIRLFLPVPQALLTAKATEGYRRIDQDVELFIYSPPNMRLSVRFPDSFYEKYDSYIEDKNNFRVMAYVLGFIDRPSPLIPQTQQQQSRLPENTNQTDNQNQENNQEQPQEAQV
ncbi:MAG: hypothetical protein SFT81_05140 [Candidatus Caenarcaniphilales bacterium]|nr:hypothetical protein [Candidatus Caenarcaniphilales bacterium]